MQRNPLLRVAVSVLALAALSPLVRADEKGDVILRKVAFKAESFKTYAATISYDEPANHHLPATVQVWFRKAPFCLKISSPDAADNRVVIKNTEGTWVGRRDAMVRHSKPYEELLGMFPMFTGNVAAFVGEIASTRWISEQPDSSTGATLDAVEVVGKKRTAVFFIDAKGFVQKIVTYRRDGSADTTTIQRLAVDEPIPDSVFATPTRRTKRQN